MFGFPVNLQDNGVQKFTNDADNGFPKIQQREIFYSVKDGFFDDSSTWQTASGRVGLLPSQLDDVYIRNYVTAANGVAKTFNVYNLTIAQNATLKTANGSVQTILNVFGSLKSYGTIDTITGTGFGFSINLYGRDNVINNYIIDGISSQTRIGYYSNNDQDILPLTYRNLETGGNGRKFLTGPTIVTRETNFSGVSGLVEFGGHDFISYGKTSIGTNFNKSSLSGTTIFYGLDLVNNGNNNRFDVTGNADIEIRGALVHTNGFNGLIRFNSGTGTWKFTTINGSIQDSNANGILPFYGNIFVDNGLTLTIGTNGIGTRVSVYMYGNIIGGNASSRLVNIDFLHFITSQAASNCMVGSLFDFTTWSMNVVHYSGNYSVTMDSRFTTYSNLNISGTGTKSLGVNTTLNGNLTASGGTFELSTYNLNVNGTSTINGGYLKKSSPGNVLFTGLLNVSSGFANAVDFTTGNPNVECRGGVTYGLNISSTYQINGGLGTWTFTTNNQSVNGNQGVSWMQLYNVIIADNITLTISTSNNVMLQINNSINGATSTSKLLAGTNGRIALNSNIQPMTTGIWDFTTNVCFVRYMSTSNQTIWHSTYSNLELENNSTKTLSSNTTINNNLNCLTDNINSIFELSNYNLTINGTTTLSGKISKSGPGNILFVGLVTWNDLVGGIDFSGGNPTIETRNGFRYLRGSINIIMTLGTSVWNFTTNNQSLYGSATTTYGNFSGGQFIIANDITLTIGPATLVINGTINGGNANSKLLISANSSVTHNNATQPMATGILDTSTNLNTWIYGSGNQDIKGGPTTGAKQVYRNLTLNGGGTKTLQGFVSVQNTYTLTSPATLNNNGFTLTNP